VLNFFLSTRVSSPPFIAKNGFFSMKKDILSYMRSKNKVERIIIKVCLIII